MLYEAVSACLGIVVWENLSEDYRKHARVIVGEAWSRCLKALSQEKTQ